MKYLPLILCLSGCNMDFELNEVEFEPLEIYVCLNGWRYDTNGNHIYNDTGGAEICGGEVRL